MGTVIATISILTLLLVISAAIITDYDIDFTGNSNYSQKNMIVHSNDDPTRQTMNNIDSLSSSANYSFTIKNSKTEINQKIMKEN
jgi:hypothetical protein